MSRGAERPPPPCPVKGPPPYRGIVFDCDSTLSAIEGIEALAVGREEQIRALTERAMNGELPLEEVYGARLEAIRPSAEQVAGLGARYLAALLPNVRELVAALTWLEKRVCIVSGGLAPPVREVGAALGIAPADVFAVDIAFDAAGAYAGFERDSPAARAGGKLELLEHIGRASGPLALVGDGATDLEAAPACARFVAFGGVVRRETVFAAADARCSEADFAALAPLLLSDDELERLERAPQHRALSAAARAFRTTP